MSSKRKNEGVDKLLRELTITRIHISRCIDALETVLDDDGRSNNNDEEGDWKKKFREEFAKAMSERRGRHQERANETRKIKKEPRISDAGQVSEESSVSTPELTHIRKPYDKHLNHIRVGDTIEYVSRGKFSSTHGVVTRFSSDLERVWSLDKERREIMRNTNNVVLKRRKKAR